MIGVDLIGVFQYDTPLRAPHFSCKSYLTILLVLLNLYLDSITETQVTSSLVLSNLGYEVIESKGHLTLFGYFYEF